MNGILRRKESILKEFEDGALSSQSQRKEGELISRGAEIGVSVDVTPKEYVRCDDTVRVHD